MGTVASLIRCMEQKDIKSVALLEKESFSDAWSEDILKQELKNPIAQLYVLEQDGIVIGYGDFWLVAGEMQLNRIAVVKAWQGRGLGKYFLGTLIEKFWTGQVESITLEVRNNNLSAQKLYESLGFCKEGCRKDYYGKGIDAVIMWLYRK